MLQGTWQMPLNIQTGHRAAQCDSSALLLLQDACSAIPPAICQATVPILPSTSQALAQKPPATTQISSAHRPNHLNSLISLAKASSTTLLKATMPPKALIGSARTASLYASSKSSRVATPQGLVCFTMTQVGSCSTLINGLKVLPTTE